MLFNRGSSYKTSAVVVSIGVDIIVIGIFGEYLVVNVGVPQGRDSKRWDNRVVASRQGFRRFWQ